MGSFRGKNRKLDSFHADICKRDLIVQFSFDPCFQFCLVLTYPTFLSQVKLLFAAEKKVCDQIFEGQDSLKDQCFAEVTGNSVAVLLSFGEAIAKSKRSPEKLFVLLDMYEIMRELQSEV